MTDIPHTPTRNDQRRWWQGSPALPAKRVQFDQPLLPWLFLMPQLAVIFVFFYWPSAQAISSSFYLEDPFGFCATFVGLENYGAALGSSEYRKIAALTAVFTLLVTAFSLGVRAFVRGQGRQDHPGPFDLSHGADFGLCNCAAGCRADGDDAV